VLAVVQCCANLQRARSRIQKIGHVRDPAFEAFIVVNRRPYRDPFADGQRGQILLRRVQHGPQRIRVADDEERREVGGALVRANLLPGIDVAFHDGAVDGTCDRERLIAAVRRAAIELQPASRTVELRLCTRVLCLRDLQILARGNAEALELFHPLQVLLCERDIRLGAARFRLCLAVFGRTQYGERLAPAHAITRLNEDACHATGERRVHAHRPIFVPCETSVQPHADHPLQRHLRGRQVRRLFGVGEDDGPALNANFRLIGLGGLAGARAKEQETERERAGTPEHQGCTPDTVSVAAIHARYARA
jgi:hypothetical protein